MGELTSSSEVAPIRGLPIIPEVPPPRRGRLMSIAEPVCAITETVSPSKTILRTRSLETRKLANQETQQQTEAKAVTINKPQGVVDTH